MRLDAGDTGQVSIRASLQPRGERIKKPFSRIRGKVSIRASLQPRGEHVGDPQSDYRGYCFNPRLASAARRTSVFVASLKACLSFNPRLASAARRTPSSVSTGHIVMFQSAPRFSREANVVIGESWDAQDVSIRASLQPRGEPTASDHRQHRKPVSIRASLQPRGELRAMA